MLPLFDALNYKLKKKKMNSIEIEIRLGGTDRCNTIVLES